MAEEKKIEEKVEEKKEEEKEKKKIDIKALVALVPPASALKHRETKRVEKRIRLRTKVDVKPTQAKISPKLANELSIGDKLEIVIAGKKKFVFETVLDENVPENEVWVNVNLMREYGVADNSIATVRAHRG